MRCVNNLIKYFESRGHIFASLGELNGLIRDKQKTTD